MPTVSAIIPTRRRPHLVAAAVQSALDEPEVREVVVVIDDHVAEHVRRTRDALRRIEAEPTSPAHERRVLHNPSEPLAHARGSQPENRTHSPNVSHDARPKRERGVPDEPAEAPASRSRTNNSPNRLVILNTPGLGNGAARNAGVAAAKGDVLAFLDDDDTWLPGKTRQQLELLEHDQTLAVGRVRADAGEAEFLWPRRLPRPGESVCEYLFCRTSLGTGEGLAQTSTWLGRASLFRELPFDESLRRYVDLDWLLRAADTHADFRLAFAGWPEPVAVWDIKPRPRISTGHCGDDALAFADERRELMSPAAYAAFVLTLGSDAACRDGRSPGFWKLLAAARRHGRPNAAVLATHCLQFAVPRGLLARAAGRRKEAACAS
jgi:glycosyltransferase involved in cell wall biosynthesis